MTLSASRMVLLPADTITLVREYLDDTSDIFLALSCSSMLEARRMLIENVAGMMLKHEGRALGYEDIAAEILRNPQLVGLLLEGFAPRWILWRSIAVGAFETVDICFRHGRSAYDVDHTYLMREAARSGNLPMFEYLLDEGYPNIDTFPAAIEAGNTELLDLLLGLNPDEMILPSFYDVAAGNGYLDVCEWLFARGQLPGPDTTLRAAENGHLHVMEWLNQRGCRPDYRSCSAAEKEGYVEMRAWLVDVGFPVDCISMFKALLYAQLEMVIWLHSVDCPWMAHSSEIATATGELDILQWAHAHGAPWSEKNYSIALRYGYRDIAQWIAESGLPR